MASNGKHPDSVKSPLHRLQTAIVKDMSFGAARNVDHNVTPTKSRSSDPHNFDAESIYSFDSVSTSGRLLDRLGLESEDYDDYDDDLRRRESFASVQSTGRLLDRLGLDGTSDELSPVYLPADRYKPVRANSSISLERMKTTNGRMPLKSAAYKVVQQKGYFSVDSLQGDIALYSQGSATSIALLLDSSGSSGGVPHTPMRLKSGSSSFPSQSSIPEAASDSSGDRVTSTLSLPTIFQSLPSSASGGQRGQFDLIGSQKGLVNLIHNHSQTIQSQNYGQTHSQTFLGPGYSPQSLIRSQSNHSQSQRHIPNQLNQNQSQYHHQNQSQSQIQSQSQNYLHRQNLQSHIHRLLILLSHVIRPSPGNRTVSASSNTSNTSLDSAMPVFNPSSRFEPSLEISTKKAIQLRLLGNHREASYQLQITASPPYNYPRAMYLYAQALKIGQGVKLNESLAVKWLCRCVLVSYIVETTALDEPSITKYVSRLSELLPPELLKLVTLHVAPETLDPFVIFDEFMSYPSSTITRMVTSNLKDGNTVGGAYYQLGQSLIQGSGLPKDEVNARLLFAKSASLGYGDAMVALGELWSTKSKNFKKDLTAAALWLRIGEIFGKKDLGNSWIYKDKYMERPKSKK